MCMNIDTLAARKRWLEEESLHIRSQQPSKTFKQRQLGLIRGSQSADAMTRRIRTAEGYSHEDTMSDRFKSSGRENRHPIDKRGPSVLSREKLRMLRQIRAENAEKLSKSTLQNDAPLTQAESTTNCCIGTVGMGKIRSHFPLDQQEPANHTLHSTLQIKSEDGQSRQRDILLELRQRSKYLPALLKEFKKLEVKCDSGDSHVTSSRAKSAVPEISCATILASIRTARESQRPCRALSAPTQPKPSPRRSTPMDRQGGLPLSGRNLRGSANSSSGITITPGVNVVYAHVPTPPHQDGRNAPRTYHSPICWGSTRPQKTSPIHGTSPRLPAGRIRSAGSLLQSPARQEKFSGDISLSCSHIGLNRSKSASEASPNILHNSAGRSRSVSTVRHAVETSLVRSKCRLGTKRKPNRIVRFSEEEDKVFEYTRDDPSEGFPKGMEDDVFVYTCTTDLRGYLDSNLGHRSKP